MKTKLLSLLTPASKVEQTKEEWISPQTRIIYNTKADSYIKTNNESKATCLSKKSKLIIAAGALITAGLGIWYLVKGKSNLNTIRDIAVDTADELSRLRQSNNLSITDYRKVGVFEKGKALINGKGYTGVLNTINGKGQNIKLYYDKGQILSSKINDKPFKDFVRDPEGKFVRIFTHLDNGDVKLVEHYYYPNGKIQLIRRKSDNIKPEYIQYATTNFGEFIGFSKSGKKILEGKNILHNQECWANLYNEDGTIKKKLYAEFEQTCNMPKWLNEETFENGQLVKKAKFTGNSYDVMKPGQDIMNIDLPSRDIVMYSNNPKVFYAKLGYSTYTDGFIINERDLKTCKTKTLRIVYEKGYSEDFYYRIDLKDIGFRDTFFINPNNFNDISSESNNRSLLKDVVSKLRKACEIVKKEKVCNHGLADKEMGYDIPEFLKKLEEFLSKN